MMGNRSRCGAERVEEPVRHPGTEEQLEECMDILEELEETLDFFRWLRDELQFAMDDISDELEDIQLRIRKAGRQLQRFRPLPAKRYEVIKEQDELPFE